MLLAFVAVTVLAFTADAQAGGKTFWTGKNGQKQPLEFLTERSGSTVLFEPLDTTFLINCPVDGPLGTYEFIFFGFQIPLVNHQFDLSFPDIQVPFDWQGTIIPRREPPRGPSIWVSRRTTA